VSERSHLGTINNGEKEKPFNSNKVFEVAGRLIASRRLELEESVAKLYHIMFFPLLYLERFFNAKDAPSRAKKNCCVNISHGMPRALHNYSVVSSL
jgi:hypothetical protein